MAAKEGKQHLSIVVCGHVDAGKSTTTGRLIFDLGGIEAREMEKLKEEARKVGKESFAFAFYMDRQKDERARGVTISITTKEFFTDRYHYTIIDAPGHRDFIKNMITGASQADVALLMVPSDGNFTASIAKGNHKAGEVQGQTRQHARLINLLGCKQMIVGCNKMDTSGYKEERYIEVRNEVKDCLTKVGWKKSFVEKSIPIIPISGFNGENLYKKSDKMPWWNGVEVEVEGLKEKIKVVTLVDALDKMVQPPKRVLDKPMRTPISGVYNIKGVGNVCTGRVEQGEVKPGDEVVFLPTHTKALPCVGKIFSVEMHHKSVPAAGAGDNVGLNVKNLPKENMPRAGDVMVLKSDESLTACYGFTAQVQVLDHPGELKVGYTPIGFVRTGRAPVRLEKINWKIGRDTGGAKLEDAPSLKRGNMAEVIFKPNHPFVCEDFKSCEGLGRIAIMEGNSVVMLGRITKVFFKGRDDAALDAIVPPQDKKKVAKK